MAVLQVHGSWNNFAELCCSFAVSAISDPNPSHHYYWTVVAMQSIGSGIGLLEGFRISSKTSKTKRCLAWYSIIQESGQRWYFSIHCIGKGARVPSCIR